MRARVARYERLEKFNPQSQPQILSYLQRMKFNVPLNPKTRKPTCDKKALGKLIKQKPDDPVLQNLRMMRSLRKALAELDDTFVHRDERYHSQYVLDVGTGRMASKSPNLMNRPAGRSEEEREIALAVRSSIVASEGYVLISRDWRAIEAQLVAYFANDPQYARISLMGSHAYYASHLLGKPVDLERPDDEVMADLDKIKKTESIYPLAKKANLALNYGMGPFLLSEELAVPFSEAVRLILVHEGMSPQVKAWKESVRMRAHKEKKLVNPWGWVSPYVFDVFRQNKNGDWTATGKQANQVLAFLPQSSGAAMLKEVLLSLDEQTADDDDFHLLVPVHDEILAECRIGTEPKYHALMKKEMERAWPELSGLVIGTEGKIGFNWSSYDKKTNPEGMRDWVDAPAF